MAVRELVIPYTPRTAFLPFHQRKQRWACLVCHRRAGKTVAAVNELIRRSIECKHPRPQHAYIAPFRDQAKRVAWDYLKYYSEPVWEAQPNESELSVKLLGGRKISIYGADNADSLRGIYLDGALLDEFGDFKPSVWGNVIRPALSDRQGFAVFGGTPKGRNEFWEVRERARKNPADWFLLEIPASTSGLIDPKELEQARKQLTPEQYAQEYEIDFSAALPGAYFGREMVLAERQGRIKRVDYDPAVPCHTAWDIGYRDDTAIWWYQVVRNEIHVIDFHASSGQSVEFYIKVIASKPYTYGIHWLPHDAKAKTLASGGKSIVEQLSVGLDFKKMAIVPNLEVQDGIQAARKALEITWFDEQGCGEGLEALRQYQREYDEDKKVFKEKPRHDWTSHAADAFRMLAVAWKHEEPKIKKHEQPRAIGVGPVNTYTMNDAWRDARPPSDRI